MALIENNASVAAEIAVNLAKKYLQNSFNNNTSECIFVSKRNPVSKKRNIYIFWNVYNIIYFVSIMQFVYVIDCNWWSSNGYHIANKGVWDKSKSNLKSELY